ncbi:hypothetical protein [Demequina silvatica]|uniref:hypothetical protein n=1 Tax=Demequina silvatica TaxID=1638988 RepID=UPI00078655F4|nr:hypothetical protein [Demequina silvatica]
MRELVFVLTDHGEHGVGVTSPQLPGLIAGVATFDEATPTYLLGLAREQEADVDGFVVFLERVVEHDGQVFVLRCRQDFGTSERARIADRLGNELAASAELRAGWPRNSLGDVTLVAALDRDLVGDIARSDRTGEPMALIVEFGDEFIAVGLRNADRADAALTVAEFVARARRDSPDAGAARELHLMA